MSCLFTCFKTSDIEFSNSSVVFISVIIITSYI
jgi:hypothetical protein